MYKEMLNAMYGKEMLNAMYGKENVNTIYPWGFWIVVNGRLNLLADINELKGYADTDSVMKERNIICLNKNSIL